VNNLFADIPAQLQEELVQELATGEDLRIERIVSRGHTAPPTGWFDQAQREWVVLLQGKAVIAYPDKPDLTLEPGDYVTIAPHEQHRVAWTTPDEDTIWLAVHY